MRDALKYRFEKGIGMLVLELYLILENLIVTPILQRHIGEIAIFSLNFQILNKTDILIYRNLYKKLILVNHKILNPLMYNKQYV